MGSESGFLRARKRRWRLLLLGASIVLLVPGIWLLAAHIAINTGVLQRRINEHPEKLLIQWKAGRWTLPWRLQLEGITVRGQGHRDQWYAEAEHADIGVRWVPLLHRRVVTDFTRLESVAFRIRPRLDAIEQGSVNPADLPSIPGLSNPPETPPVFKPHVQSGNPWTLELGGIEIRDLRELWIKEGQLLGSGHLEGSIDHEIRGPFTADVTRFVMPTAQLLIKRTVAITNFDAKLSGRLGPIRFKVDKGLALFSRLTAESELKGDLANLDLYQHHLGKVKSVALSGGGRLDAHTWLERGEFLPPTRFRIHVPDMEMRLANIFVNGRAEIGVEVAQNTNGVTSTMTTTLSAVRLRHEGDSVASVDSGDVRLRAIAYDPKLPDGFRDVAVALELAPIEIPDARVLNAFMPSNAGLSFLRGSFRVGANYSEDRDRSGSGRISVEGNELDFRLGSRDFTGRLDAQALYRAQTNGIVLLDDARVNVTNVVISGVKNRRADGWFASIGLDDGTLNRAASNTLAGDVSIHVDDIRPLLAWLREDEESAGWARWVPNLKDLRGQAAVRLAPEEVTVRNLAMRGKATEIMAQLHIRDGKPDGILYARYGLISAGFDFRGGGRKWTILGAKRGYMKMLAEMGIEGAPLPDDLEKSDAAGEDPPGAETRKSRSK